MRRKLIAANWKMNTPPVGAAEFARSVTEQCADAGCDIALFPPFTLIDAVARETAGTSVTVGAQNVFYERGGAYTGEVSCHMLKSAGCSMVIVGHSERRHILGESDSDVAAKAKAVADSGMGALLCVGETERERNEGNRTDVVKRQIETALSDVPAGRITVAYEPVWAIGTGNNAETGQIESMHGEIRGFLSGIFGDASKSIRILYGGSVGASNARVIAEAEGVDGMLVGTASLEFDSFKCIIDVV